MVSSESNWNVEVLLSADKSAPITEDDTKPKEVIAIIPT